LIDVFEDASLGCDTNYLMAFVDRPGDWLDDWSVSIANFGDLARLAKDGGFVGIALDNEQYGGRVWNWPEDAAQPGLGYAAYAAAAREKGLEIGAVMRDAFPEIRVLLLHGPYIADGDVPNDIRRNQFGVGEFELFGPFYAGLLEGVGERGRVIDGGEVYALRDAGEFARHAHWRRWTLSSATHDAAFLDEADRARHRSRGEVSFGVYPREFPAGFVMSPSILRTTLEHAMRHSGACDVVVLRGGVERVGAGRVRRRLA
jgi:hypothetical protein